MSLPKANPQGNRSCLYYFVHLDAEGRPIPGTMYGKQDNNKIDAGYKCREARVTGLPMTAPVGYVACTKNPTGLRYWYQVVSIPTGGGNSRNEIVPNSMIAVRGVPQSKAKQGTGGRPCQYMEFKVFEPIGEVEVAPFQNLESL